MWDTVEKDSSVLAEKCIANKSPVMIWIPKQSPKRDPKFHMYEIFEGEGKSIKELFTIFRMGWDFRIFIIKLLFVMGLCLALLRKR